MNEQQKQAAYEKIAAWIDDHKDSLIEDIKHIVSIRSVSNPTENPEMPFGEGCRKVLDAALALGESYGFTAHNYENYVGSLTFGERQKNIGFWGHLDVVPEGDGWDFPPYAPEYIDGFLIGRGVEDNKGPSLGVMYVLRAMHELNIPLKCGLKLFFGTDEERGFSDIKYYTQHYACPDINIVADSSFPVCYGEKGIIEGRLIARGDISGAISAMHGGVASNVMPDKAVMEINAAGIAQTLNTMQNISAHESDGKTHITASGISRHTAFPYGGINAIHVLCQAVMDLEDLSESDRRTISFFKAVNDDFNGTSLGIAFSDEESGALTCVGSTLALNEAKLTLGLNIRYSITANSDEIIQKIRGAAHAAGCEFILERDSKPNYFPREHPAVGLLTDIYNQFTGLDTQPYVMGGGTYARGLPNAFGFGMGGIPHESSDIFRPGHGGGHAPDEGLHVDSLITGMKIFARGILAIDDIV